jgi:WD40 repeat protein
MDSAVASALPTVSSATAPSLDLTVISAATVSQVKLQTKLSGHAGRVFSVAFSSDGRLLASAGQNNEVKLWDLTTQQEIKSFKHNGGWEVFFLANDQQLALSTGEVWNIESGEIVHAAATNRSQSTFSSDGRWMALAPSNLPIELWNTATWQIERTLDKHSDAVIGMAFSADSSLLATGSALGPDNIADISIKLWDVAGGRELFTLEGHRTDIHAVAFSPDGSLLVSGGIDPTVKIWDVKSGQLIRSLQSGEGVMDVIFSPDGTLVASAGSDGTVKLWDAINGKLLKTLVHPDELMTVAFSPDGTLLASGSYDNLVYLWGISK